MADEEANISDSSVPEKDSIDEVADDPPPPPQESDSAPATDKEPSKSGPPGEHTASSWRNPGDHHHQHHHYEANTTESLQTAAAGMSKHPYAGGFDPALKQARKVHAKGAAVSPQKSAGSSTSVLPLPAGPYMPNGLRGGRFGTGKPKSDVDWSIYRAAQVPGPGHYGAPQLPATSGGRFSSANPKSDVEWEMLRASKIPAPGQYELKEHIPTGGRFSSACPKSDLELKMLRASQVPGPGQYPLSKHDRLPGGRMSTSAIVTDVDLTMRRSSKIPGPGAYDFSYGSGTSGGRFSTSKPKTEVEWIMHRSRQIPGPGEYKRPVYMPSGGKFGESKPKTALEQIMYQSAKVPGPGNYDIDMYSIGRRAGAVTPLPKSAASTKPSTPHSAGIPPEARRKPKAKKTAALEEASSVPPSGPRPHTSLGIMEGGKKTSAESSFKREQVKSPSGTAWYKRGVSREGSGLKAKTPGAWLLPESAQRAYGVWNMDALSAKKPKRRQNDASATKPVVIKVHVDSVNPPKGTNDDYEMEVFEDAPEESVVPADGKGGVNGRGASGAVGAKREELSENAQKLFDLAMESDEFRRMMQLYTGMDDPTSVIENYAEMWAKQPLVVGTKSGRPNNRQTAAKHSEKRRPTAPATR